MAAIASSDILIPCNLIGYPH